METTDTTKIVPPVKSPFERVAMFANISGSTKLEEKNKIQATFITRAIQQDYRNFELCGDIKLSVKISIECGKKSILFMDGMEDDDDGDDDKQSERDNIKNNCAPLISTISIAQNKYISGEDFMSKNGRLSDYLIKDMPFDNVNGFKGNDEYDLKGYLTKLLLASHDHNINPVFQQECQYYFDNILNKQHGTKCEYIDVRVTTREKATMKARIDYTTQQWPHPSNIFDRIRCSVTLKCLRGIVTITNDFSSLELNGNNLKGYHYCDVKCDVLIEYIDPLTTENEFIIADNYDLDRIDQKRIRIDFYGLLLASCLDNIFKKYDKTKNYDGSNTSRNNTNNNVDVSFFVYLAAPSVHASKTAADYCINWKENEENGTTDSRRAFARMIASIVVSNGFGAFAYAIRIRQFCI